VASHCAVEFGLLTVSTALVNVFEMKTIIYFFILLGLCACSNKRTRESCLNFDPSLPRYIEDDESAYEANRRACEGQHGTKVDRETFFKYRKEQELQILKENCTCEEGFLTRAKKHPFENDSHSINWSKKCAKISMDKEYLRGLELAKGAEAKRKTEKEIKNSQNISSETAQAFCKKN
jgi:hypothetical protein